MYDIEEEFCRNQSTILALIKKLKDTILKIMGILSGIVKVIMSIKWMDVKALLDLLLQQLLAAAAVVAGNLAQSLAGALSGVIAGILERVLGIILKILMLGPSIIYGLAAIPYDYAVQKNIEEHKNLSKIYGLIREINFLILRLKGLNGNTDIKSMMEKANIHLDVVIAELGKALGSLSANQRFDERAYDKASKNLQMAIDATDPSDVGALAQVVDAAFQNRKQVHKSEGKADLNKKKKEARENLTQWRNKKLMPHLDIEVRNDDITRKADEFLKQKENTDNDGLVNKAAKFMLGPDNDLSKAIETAENIEGAGANTINNARTNLDKGVNKMQAVVINEAYDVANKFIDSYYEAAETVNEMDASFKATGDIFSEGGYLEQEVTNKVQLLKIILTQILKKIGEIHNTVSDSSSAYRGKRMSIYSIMKLEDNIRAIINWFLRGIMGMSDAAEDTLTKSIQDGLAIVETVHESFDDAINSDYSATKMTMKLATGHNMLFGSKALMDAIIVGNLIELANLDNLFEESNEAYEAFAEKIKTIPDWDGTLDRWWDVHNNENVVTPYLELRGDTAKLTLQAFTMTPDDLAKEMKPFADKIKRMKKHNEFVQEVLYSYTPIRNEYTNELQEILKALGLLEAFATLMDMAGLINNLLSIVDFYKGIAMIDCLKNHPEVMSPEAIAAATEHMRNAEAMPMTLTERDRLAEQQQAAMEERTRQMMGVLYEFNIDDQEGKNPFMYE